MNSFGFFTINLMMFFFGGVVWHLINKMKDK
jgi:cbb3-type cytochrome oxidase subunit 3